MSDLLLYSYSPTWSDAKPSLWSIVEVAAATLASCAITYRPLLNKIFRIPSFPPGSEDKTSPAGVAESSDVDIRMGLESNINNNMKTQNLNIFHPYVSASKHSPRTTKSENRSHDSMRICKMDNVLDAREGSS